ncbi:hypothetical protein DPX16_19828 [Anabarilius grahami]|uniref:Uncharacterized protein n=1 Tax=Anabarilius grahami TaxID=495550 RepID=A0A3N0Y719_ANAGA|nr:hypothetical protein DPX16_19828 [Anabarilius grahami]
MRILTDNSFVIYVTTLLNLYEPTSGQEVILGVRNCRMSVGTAAAQTRYIQKQLVPSIQPRQEQVGLSRLTAPSLTQPPPYGPQQPERKPCQNCVTHKD